MQGSVIVLLAKLHVVGTDAQFLHHHIFVALELRIRLKGGRSSFSTSSRSIRTRSSLPRLVRCLVSARSFSDDCDFAPYAFNRGDGLPK